ncbi:expressed unknown protein [Seminavis robusta]|uniref:Uncharacterized protein n=1 Tax=Seminavis robusta TaxID=568900 RepID=A0A9N8HU02_9STRA|nr:expressed unknown protein [Seminavis robusta]|eukprot:Sro1971_g308590.1 n/a (699) ;mRNA; f:9430-11633
MPPHKKKFYMAAQQQPPKAPLQVPYASDGEEVEVAVVVNDNTAVDSGENPLPATGSGNGAVKAGLRRNKRPVAIALVLLVATIILLVVLGVVQKGNNSNNNSNGTTGSTSSTTVITAGPTTSTQEDTPADENIFHQEPPDTGGTRVTQTNTPNATTTTTTPIPTTPVPTVPFGEATVPPTMLPVQPQPTFPTLPPAMATNNNNSSSSSSRIPTLPPQTTQPTPTAPPVTATPTNTPGVQVPKETPAPIMEARDTAPPTTATPVNTATPVSSPTTSTPTTSPPTTTPTTALPTLTPTTPAPTRVSFRERHSSYVGMLDLQDWEQASLDGLIAMDRQAQEQDAVQERQGGISCNPPSGVSSSCCVGGFSSGGDMSILYQKDCAKSMLQGAAIDDLRKDAQTYYNLNPIPGDGGAFECDVCQIVELVRSQDLKIAFLGDSTQNQVAEGFACELERRGYEVHRASFAVNQEFDGTWANRRHLSTRTMQIRSPLWADGQFARIQYHQMYLLPMVEPEHLTSITAQTDILVLGFGLHWWFTNSTPNTFRRADAYYSAMLDLFRVVRLQNHVQLVAHRQTSAEHYDSPGGDWFQWYGNRDNLAQSCVPLAAGDDVAGWRERAVSKAAADASYDIVLANSNMPAYPSGTGNSEVVLLPYFDFTAKQYTMHPFRGDSQDCTHYCSSPFLYMPIWRSLRLAMDRQWSS